MKKLFLVLICLFSGIISFAQSDSIPKPQPLGSYPITESTQIKNKRQSFLINISIGPSFRVVSNPQGLDAEQAQYVKDLKSGVAFGASAYYLKDNNVGFGLKYSMYSSSEMLANQTVNDPSGETGHATISDDIQITFIGASAAVIGREFFKNDNVMLEFALGYIGYKDNFKVINDYKLTGGNLGISTEFGYNFSIAKNVLIGPSVSFTGGVLNQYKLEGNNTSETIKLDDETTESLYRFDLSFNARFIF